MKTLMIIPVVSALVVCACAEELDISITKVENDLRVISNALRFYRLDCGLFPSDELGLNTLLDETGDDCDSRQSAYISELPIDPKGGPYRYRLISEDQFEVAWLGLDGKPGGDGKNTDILRVETWSPGTP